MVGRTPQEQPQFSVPGAGISREEEKLPAKYQKHNLRDRVWGHIPPRITAKANVKEVVCSVSSWEFCGISSHAGVISPLRDHVCEWLRRGRVRVLRVAIQFPPRSVGETAFSPRRAHVSLAACPSTFSARVYPWAPDCSTEGHCHGRAISGHAEAGAHDPHRGKPDARRFREARFDTPF